EHSTFRAGEVVPGAHLQLLQNPEWAGAFDRHVLFTVPETLEDARLLVGELAALPVPLRSEIELVQLADPTDLTQIAYALKHALLRLDERARLLDAELWVLLNTGTPQMQAAWLLLHTHGLLRVRILQTSPEPMARRSGSAAVREAAPSMGAWQRMFAELRARQGS
ncbi:MAG: hypothetical protein IT463_13555, partial [Planctomycetes bacterium]|nr:hypothetical protein [Planctomycetota bacterium]